MKNPWLTFACICSVVLVIVLFSVVFGGYSSFLRSQSRVVTARGLLIDQSRNQLDLAKELTALPGSPADARPHLLDAVGICTQVLDRMETSESPLAQQLISEYEAAQIRVNEAVNIFLHEAKITENITLNQVNEMETQVFIAGRRYNKEARYFNTRTQVFPGFLIARIFGFDKVYYTEIAVDLLNPLNPLAEKEASSAS